MFVRKNLLQEGDVVRRNGLLKAITLFLLGASVVLLFSSADLVLNPGISNSFVYLQKMFLSPSGTMNTNTSISLDGSGGVVDANQLKINNICDKNGLNCFKAEDIQNVLNKLNKLESDVSSLSGRVVANPAP